ncbi:Phosphoinositide phosphatase SAC2 [Platanthera guangdongensis]|uniref:Phosphoinositide phosphatase SAC2 n=1 Tax=Platanthera guangdongensis TaxID=2320717 RepID=A0ABR2LGW2_9ASPA
MLGRDKGRTLWRVLKVDRLEALELNVREDSTTYSESECNELLKCIHEGNMSTGGLRFVTNCYGIVGISMSLLKHHNHVPDVFGSSCNIRCLHGEEQFNPHVQDRHHRLKWSLKC